MNDETTPRRLGLQRETRHDTEEVSARGVRDVPRAWDGSDSQRSV